MLRIMKRPASITKRVQSGFSLVEVIVALAVLIFGLFGVLELYTNSRMILMRSEMKVKAEDLAKNKLEELKSLGYDTLDNKLGPSSESFLLTSERSEFQEGIPDYSWKAILTENEDNPGIIAIEISLNYMFAGRQQPDIVLRDLVSK